MLKILQARLQQYLNQELPDVQAGFRKGRGTRDEIANICWTIEKSREFQKNIYFCFIDYAKAFDCVDHKVLCRKYIYQKQTSTCLSGNVLISPSLKNNLSWNSHKINHFKTNSSVSFRAFRVLYNYHLNLVLKHFHHFNIKSFIHYKNSCSPLLPFLVPEKVFPVWLYVSIYYMQFIYKESYNTQSLCWISFTFIFCLFMQVVSWLNLLIGNILHFWRTVLLDIVLLVKSFSPRTSNMTSHYLLSLTLPTRNQLLILLIYSFCEMSLLFCCFQGPLCVSLLSIWFQYVSG